MSYLDEPPIGSVLYAVEVPPRGGETGFGNLYRAYETLPADLKAADRGPGLHPRRLLQQRRRAAAGLRSP